MRTIRMIMMGIWLMVTASAYAAVQLPPEENTFVDQVLNFYNQNDDKSVFKDSVTGRFRASADFADFQKTMAAIHGQLGKSLSKQEVFIIKDRYADAGKSYEFYRAAFDVLHEKGTARHYFVLMHDKDRVLIDGWAVREENQKHFLFAQGNLYNMPLEAGGTEILPSSIPRETLKDSRTDYLEEKGQEESKELSAKADFAASAAIHGNFMPALAIWQENIHKIMTQAGPNWVMYVLMGNIGDKAQYKAGISQENLSQMVRMADSCNKTTPEPEKVVEHCRISGIYSGEWTMVNGRVQGAFKVWDIDKHLLANMQYKDNVLDGRQEHFYPTAELAGWMEYRNGVLLRSQELGKDGKVTYEWESVQIKQFRSPVHQAALQASPD